MLIRCTKERSLKINYSWENTTFKTSGVYGGEKLKVHTNLQRIQSKWKNLFRNCFKNIPIEMKSGARPFHKAVTFCNKKTCHYVSTSIFLTINTTYNGLYISDNLHSSVDHNSYGDIHIFLCVLDIFLWRFFHSLSWSFSIPTIKEVVPKELFS